jgi:hypothetical protein
VKKQTSSTDGFWGNKIYEDCYLGGFDAGNVSKWARLTNKKKDSSPNVYKMRPAKPRGLAGKKDAKVGRADALAIQLCNTLTTGLGC